MTTSRATQNQGNSQRPALVVESSTAIYMAWQDTTAGNDEIYVRKSEDGAVLWGKTTRITNTPGSSQIPRMR